MVPATAMKAARPSRDRRRSGVSTRGSRTAPRPGGQQRGRRTGRRSLLRVRMGPGTGERGFGMDRAALLEQTVERLALEEADLVSILSQAVALAGSDRHAVGGALQLARRAAEAHPSDLVLDRTVHILDLTLGLVTIRESAG